MLEVSKKRGPLGKLVEFGNQSSDDKFGLQQPYISPQKMFLQQSASVRHGMNLQNANSTLEGCLANSRQAPLILQYVLVDTLGRSVADKKIKEMACLESEQTTIQEKLLDPLNEEKDLLLKQLDSVNEKLQRLIAELKRAVENGLFKFSAETFDQLVNCGKLAEQLSDSDELDWILQLYDASKHKENTV